MKSMRGARDSLRKSPQGAGRVQLAVEISQSFFLQLPKGRAYICRLSERVFFKLLSLWFGISGFFRVSTPRHNSFSSWRRRLLTAAAVVCACVWFAPQRVEASCGDYVMVGHPLQQGDHGSLYGGKHAGKPVGFPVCNGPGCRQRREAPASPPTRITLDEHSWGLPPRLVNLTPESSSFCDLSAESAMALSVASGVFRPPRLTSIL